MSWVFLTAAGLQVAGLFLDRQLVPWAGTAAVAALFALAWTRPAAPGSGPASPAAGPRWSRWTALSGLALLTVTAAVVDARTDGYGWPAKLTEGDAGSQLVEAALMTSSATLLAVTILARVAKLVRRAHLPAALFAALLILVTAGVPLIAPTAAMGLAVAELAAALVVLGFAVNAAAVSRGLPRQAGAGFLSVVFLALSVWPAVLNNELLDPSRQLFPAYTDSIVVLSPRDRGRTDTQVDMIRALGEKSRIRPEFATLPTDLPAVREGPLLPNSIGDEGTDWDRARPALRATILLLGLTLLVTSLFPRSRHVGLMEASCTSSRTSR